MKEQWEIDMERAELEYKECRLWIDGYEALDRDKGEGPPLNAMLRHLIKRVEELEDTR